MKQILLQKSYHREKHVLCLVFDRDPQLEKAVRTLPDCKWSQTMRCWYLPNNPENLRMVLSEMRQLAYVDYTAVFAGKTGGELKETKPAKIEKKKSFPLAPASEEAMKKFKDWLTSKRYSPNTIKTYTEALTGFLRFFSDKQISEISNQDVIRYNNEYILANKYSSSFQNQVVNAIKLFFRTVENKTIDAELIHRPKRERLLPNVLSKEEVKALLEAPTNLKHRTMLSLIYACGLRRGELLKLKPNDVDANRKLLLIRQSKGKKDRVVPLSDKIIGMMEAYSKIYKPEIWVFEGQKAGEPYSEKSLQSVLKQALEKAGIKKPGTLHWLRHSYATHLLEGGTNLRYIQELLGHQSSKTTEIYTHVSTRDIQKIKSPFDDL